MDDLYIPTGEKGTDCRGFYNGPQGERGASGVPIFVGIWEPAKYYRNEIVVYYNNFYMCTSYETEEEPGENSTDWHCIP